MRIVLTPWFPLGTKPARLGVYQQLNNNGEPGYQAWNGELWFGWESSPERAARNQWPVPSRYQRDKWRGLMIVED